MSPDKKTVSCQQIANRAYEIWEARDRPPGDGVEDWLRLSVNFSLGTCLLGGLSQANAR